MKLTEKQQLVAVVVGAAVLIVAELSFAWLHFSQRGEIQTELQALEVRQATAENKLAQIPKLQARARELSEIVDQYTEILPREDEVSPDAFLDDISALCKEVGLDIISAKPMEVKVEGKRPRSRPVPGRQNQQKEAPKSFVQHKYRFEMEGEFPGLHRFINGVENHTRFLQIDHLEIAPISGKQRGSNKKDELEMARNPRKQVVVEVSTYTYSALPQVEEANQ